MEAFAVIPGLHFAFGCHVLRSPGRLMGPSTDQFSVMEDLIRTAIS